MTPPRVLAAAEGSAGGYPGDGRRREPAPHPALRGHLPPRGKARVVVGGSASLRGASGTPPPTVCPRKGGDGSLSLIRHCGATFPQGGRQGLQGRDSSLPGKGGDGRSRRGGGTPPYVWGDMETLWGLREQSFPGRRAVGAGHARPGGLRRQASTVRPVGRGLDPSAGGCPGDGCWREVLRGVGDAAPYTVCPGKRGSGSLPLIRPCGATFPRGGRQGLLLAAAQAVPYPGSWSSVRSWRVRL